MATILTLAVAITLALGMLLVPAIGTIVFAQNMTGDGGLMTGNMTGNMSGKIGNMTGNVTEKIGNMTGGMIGNMTG
jgi:hypothetical protein